MNNQQPDTAGIKQYFNYIYAPLLPDAGIVAGIYVFLIPDMPEFNTGANFPVTGGANRVIEI